MSTPIDGVARTVCDAARYARDDTLGSRRRRLGRQGGARRPRDRHRGRSRARSRRRSPSTPDAVAGAIAEVVGRFDDRRARSAARCRPSSSHGVVRTAANIDQAWIGTDARGVVHATRSGRPVQVLNDADAAGVAEVRFGVRARRDGRRRDGHARNRRRHRAVRRRRARPQHGARPHRGRRQDRRQVGVRRDAGRHTSCRGRTGRSASTRTSRSCTRCCGAT